jgi:outer membrane protein OmpA-like peptidoglycan-associated protein
MFNASDIRPQMEVLGSDGSHVGTVDHIDGDRIKLARRGSSDNEHHHVPLSAVTRVNNRVHLSTTAAALGLSDAAAVHATTDTHNPLPPIRNPAVKDAHPRRNYYLPWVLLGLALLAILLLLTRSCSDERNRDDSSQAAATNSTAPLAVETVRLPNGRSVEVATTSLNYALQRYLASDEPTPRAFVFDNLNFDTASAAIRQQDVGTINTLAEILRAYPNARARVVGYTDAEGSAAGNAALGQLRAEAVAAALVDQRVNKSRLEAASGGESRPLDSNRSNSGRAENRRTELVVTAK